MQERTGTWVLLIIAGFSAIAMFTYKIIKPLSELNFDTSTLMTALGGLLVITVLIERATEFYVNSDGKQRKLNKEIEILLAQLAHLHKEREENSGNEIILAKINEMHSDTLVQLQKAREQSAEQRMEASLERQRYAIITSLILGGFSALIGFRILFPFLPENFFKECQESAWLCQETWFTGVDVILTTALISGGVAGLHWVWTTVRDNIFRNSTINTTHP